MGLILVESAYSCFHINIKLREGWFEALVLAVEVVADAELLAPHLALAAAAVAAVPAVAVLAGAALTHRLLVRRGADGGAVDGGVGCCCLLCGCCGDGAAEAALLAVLAVHGVAEAEGCAPHLALAAGAGGVVSTVAVLRAAAVSSQPTVLAGTNCGTIHGEVIFFNIK